MYIVCVLFSDCLLPYKRHPQNFLKWRRTCVQETVRKQHRHHTLMAVYVHFCYFIELTINSHTNPYILLLQRYRTVVSPVVSKWFGLFSHAAASFPGLRCLRRQSNPKIQGTMTRPRRRMRLGSARCDG